MKKKAWLLPLTFVLLLCACSGKKEELVSESIPITAGDDWTLTSGTVTPEGRQVRIGELQPEDEATAIRILRDFTPREGPKEVLVGGGHEPEVVTEEGMYLIQFNGEYSQVVDPEGNPAWCRSSFENIMAICDILFGADMCKRPP